MKRYLILSTAILTLTLVINSSCAQDNSLFRHIAPDATGVYRINMPLLSSKVNWLDLISRIPTGKMKGKDQQWVELMKEPSETGVDFKGDILITSSIDPSAKFITVILHLADSSKFRILLRKQFHGIRITRFADKSYSAFMGKTGIAWNRDLAVVVEASASGNDTGNGEGSEPGSKPSPPNNEAMIVSKCVHTLKGWDSSPIANDPSFKEAFSNDADFQTYTEKTNYYYKGLGKIIPSGVMKNFHWDSLMFYKNSYCGLWFSNGRITMHCTTVLQPQVAEELAKMPPPALNPDLLARVPKGDLLGLASIRFNPSVISYLLNRIGIGKMADSALASNNIRLEDIANAFKGDILLAMIAPAPADSTQKFQKPKPEIYTAISVNDPSAVNKWMDMLRKAKDSSSKASPDGSGDSTKKATFLGKLKNEYVMKDNILVISSSKEMSEGYFANTGRRTIDAQLNGDLQRNPLFLWIDMGAILNLILGPASSSDDGADAKMKMLNSLHTLDKMIISKTILQDGKINTEFEFSVTKKDQNILKTLLDMIPESKPRIPQH
jgi:hypothetical protein